MFTDKRKHYVKSVCIWSFSGPYFFAFRFSTGNIRIQSEVGKRGPERLRMRTLIKQ